MEAPKLVIATNGESTMALLDGIVIGPGIRRLEFSVDGSNGAKSTIRVLDLDVESVCLSSDKEQFRKFVEHLGEAREQQGEEIRKLIQEARESQ